MPLIQVESGKAVAAEDAFANVADDADLPQSGGAIVSLARFQKERETLLARNAPIPKPLNTSRSGKPQSRHARKLAKSVSK